MEKKTSKERKERLIRAASFPFIPPFFPRSYEGFGIEISHQIPFSKEVLLYKDVKDLKKFLLEQIEHARRGCNYSCDNFTKYIESI